MHNSWRNVPSSRLIDAIACVSNLQRQMWSGGLNVATKESLVGEKRSDKGVPEGHGNR